MDLDPQGHASMMAGVDVETGEACVADAFGLHAQQGLDQVVRASSRENLWVAPAIGRMATMERDLYRWGHRLEAIPRALAPVAEQYDAVVIDTPPQLNAYTEAALAAGDVMVVPVPAMAHSLQGLDEIQMAWQDATNGSGARMVAAVNLWDRRTTATNAAMEETFKDLALPLAKSRVLRAEALNQAGLSFEFVYDYAPSSEVARCLRDLADELWRMAGRKKSTKSKAGKS